MLNHERLKEGSQLLLFLLLSCFCSAQNITIDNKSDFPVEIGYSRKKLEINVNQKQTINEKFEIKNISILYKNDKKLKRNIYVFLNPHESLIINLRKDTVKFKGDKDRLHDYVNGQFGELMFKIGEYQKYAQNNDAKGFIRASEMYLADVLTKVERLNNSPVGRKDIITKKSKNWLKNVGFLLFLLALMEVI